MAISYVGGYTAGGAANWSGAAFSFGLPSGTLTDDVAIGIIYSRSNSKTVTNVTGMTQLQYTSTANGGMIWVGYVVLASDGLGTVGSFDLNSVSNGTSGWEAVVFRGVDTSSPIRASATPAAGGASNVPNPPSVTITSGDTVVAIFGKMDDCAGSGSGGMTAPSTPSSFTIATDACWQSTSGTDGSSGAAYLLAYASTSCDPGTFTTTSGGLSTYWYADTVALKPQGAVTREITLARESTSSVAVLGSSTQAIHEVVLARESTSSVVADGSKTEATWEITLALESSTSASIASSALRQGARGTLIEDFDVTGEWTPNGTGVTLDYDTAHLRESQTQAVRLNIPASTSGWMYKTLASPVDMSAVDSVELWFYVDTTYTGSAYSNSSQFVRFGTDVSNYYQRANHGGNFHPGWNVARWSPTISLTNQPQWTTVGSPNWNAIDYIHFGVTTSSWAMSLTYCSLRINAYGARSAFLMTYDDGNEAVYDNRSILNTRGMHGTPYVTTNSIGGGGKMTAAELQTLASEGWYIGNHTPAHTDLTTQTYEQVQALVTEGRQDIQAISGLENHGKHGAYPYGWHNATSDAAIRDLGTDLTWREVGGTNSCLEDARLAPLCVSSQSQLETNTLVYWQEVIDLADTVGDAVVALVHTPGTTMTTQIFTDLCEYAAVTKGMWCPNIDEWYEYAMVPGVGKVDATWSITLALESTTSVAAIGSVTEGTPGVHEVQLSLESTSSASVIGSEVMTQVLDAEVFLEMLDVPLQTTVSGDQDWLRTEEWFNPGNYDGDCAFYFDVVAANVTGAQIQLVDATDNDVKATVTEVTTSVWNYRVPFTPDAANHKYILRTLSNAAQFKVWNARIVVQQRGATKTRVSVAAFMGMTYGSTSTVNDYTGGSGLSAGLGSADIFTSGSAGSGWKYTAANWATITDATFEVLTAQSASGATTANAILANTGNTALSTIDVKSDGTTITRHTATGLTLVDGDIYKVRVQGDSSHTNRIFKSRLYLTLNTATKIETYIHAIGSNTSIVADSAYDYSRAHIDLQRYSGTPAVYLETLGYLASTEDFSYHLNLCQFERQDYGGTGTIASGTGINFNTQTTRALVRSGDYAAGLKPNDSVGVYINYNAATVHNLGSVIVITAQAAAPATNAYPTYVGVSGVRDSYAVDPSICTVPAGVKANDVLLLATWAGDTVASTISIDTPTDPSSITWNAATSVLANNSVSYDKYRLWWRRVASASEGGTVITINHTNESTPLFLNYCVAYRGCETSGDPWDGIATSQEDTQTATHDVAAISLSGSNRTLALFLFHEDNTVGDTGPTGYVNRYADYQAQSFDATVGFFEKTDVSSAPATTLTLGAIEVGATIHVALKPAAGGAATHEITLALESTSSVAVEASQTQAIHDVALALESTSSVAVLGSKTDATWEIVLARESLSSVAALGSKTEATWEITLALQSTSSVTVAGSQTQAIYEVVLARESLSSVAVEPLVTQAIREIILALESTTSAAAIGSITHAVHEVTLTRESTSSVTVAGSKIEATWDITLARESTSSVAALGSKIDATWEVVLARESTSSVAAVGAKSGIQEIALALESTTAVTVATSQTQAVYEVTLALESTSSVTVAASQTQAVYEVVLARESTTSVTAAGSKTEAVWEVVLARESTSAVTVASSQTQAVHEIALARESTTSVTVAGSKTDATWEIALARESTSSVAVTAAKGGTQEVTLALESTTAVTVAASQTQAIYEVTLARESTTSVAVVGSLTHATHEVVLARESTSSVTAVGAKVEAAWEITLARESTTSVVAVGVAIREVTLARESTTAVAVIAAKSGTQEIYLALESRTAVTVAASQTQAVYEVTLARESTTVVTAAGSITHATHEVVLARESTTIVAAIGAKTEAVWEIVLARESQTAVSAIGNRTIEVRLALESQTAVEVAAGASGTSEVTLALESKTSVAVTPSQTQAVYEVTLARESSTAVTVAGSVVHATHEVTLARESTSRVAVEATWVPLDKVISLALESRTSVSVTPSKIGNDLELVVGAPVAGWNASIIYSGWTALAAQAGWRVKKPR